MLMNRTKIINYFINKRNYLNYLEIGLGKRVRNNFSKVKAPNKISVDPDPTLNPTFRITSDQFFKENSQKFDLIFIDGLHEASQVTKDIQNSLMHLNEDGVIVLHDCNPIKEIHQRVPQETAVWNGNVWKAWVKYITTSPYLCLTVNTDQGCGIIDTTQLASSTQKFNIPDNLTYTQLDLNREKWLQLISEERFKEFF